MCVCVCILTVVSTAVKIKIKMHVTANLKLKHECSFILIFSFFVRKENKKDISLSTNFFLVKKK